MKKKKCYSEMRNINGEMKKKKKTLRRNEKY